MKLEFAEDFVLDDQVEVSFDELAAWSGLSKIELRELVESGVLIPNNPQQQPWTFRGNYVVTVRSVCRLRDDFELDANMLPLAYVMVARIRDLEAQLRELQATIPAVFRQG
jgi:chaperone modulatory protein CbpM